MSLDAGDVLRALDPSLPGRFVLTSAHESKRLGVFVTSVQPCGLEPPLVCLECQKGHAIDPLIRDSRHFALCRVDAADKLVARKFAFDGDGRGDPFDSLEVDRLVSQSPVIRRAQCAIDCEVLRHLELESDHKLYIGRVLAVRL
jgi:flavin reductase (DIM6/NTAB) family NADH-FMN oxidoreductase RutF